jgi:hypothetical protein
MSINEIKPPDRKKVNEAFDNLSMNMGWSVLRLGNALDDAFAGKDDTSVSLDRIRDIHRVMASLQSAPQAALTEDMPNLDTLIDRILQRQERRTPGYVLRSQAMQRVLVRLDAALEGDDVTLRAEVAAVIEDLGSVIHWEY